MSSKGDDLVELFLAQIQRLQLSMTSRDLGSSVVMIQHFLQGGELSRLLNSILSTSFNFNIVAFARNMIVSNDLSKDDILGLI
jgi:hypothetical protein